MLEARMDYPKHAVWQFLQPLVKEGLVVRYEEVEIPHAGVESGLELLRKRAGLSVYLLESANASGTSL